MELMQLAKQFITDTNNDGKIDLNETLGSLSRLFSGSGSGQSSMDLSGIVSRMQGTGLADIVGSWLGDGENKPISGQQISDLFGSDKVNDFASSLNMDANSTQEALAKFVPQMIDKNSSSGQLNDLLNAAGGLEGISESIGKLFSGKAV